MRVGVFVGAMGATEGGGNTLRSSILNALQEGSNRHEFIIFRSSSSAKIRNSTSFPLIEGARKAISRHTRLGPLMWGVQSALRNLGSKRPEQSFEDRCLHETKVDAVWFLRPAASPVAVPYVTTVWDLEHRKQPWFPEVSVTGWDWNSREKMYRALLPRAARILTGTQAGKEEVVAFYAVNPNNVRVVPHPAADEFRNVKTQRGGDVRHKYNLSNSFIVYPAQFWPHKNHINLLLALQLVNKKAKRPLDLVLTGSDKGNLDHVQKTINALELRERVHIVGFVPVTDIAGLYREAIAMVYPSLFGPDNLPPLEAFAMGCPVAASHIDGAADQLGDAALFFNPVDPASIAEAIQMIQIDALRETLLKRGYELVAQRTPRIYVEQVCDIFDELEAFRRCWGQDYIHT